MSGRDLTTQEKLSLEMLVDSAGLCAVLQSLSEICGEKAEHIRENWQDKPLARAWDSAAGAVGCCAANFHVERVGRP